MLLRRYRLAMDALDADQLVIFGGGRMGECLVRGLLDAGDTGADRVVVVETHAGRRAELAAGLARDFAGLTVADNPDVLHPGASVVLAVKPGDAEAVCGRVGHLDVRRLLSVAAGVPIARLEGWLGQPGRPPVAVLRAMPNTAALVGAGAAAVSAGSHAGPDDLAWATAVLASVGTVATLPEALLDAVTGLSGSGPAYIFLIVEALVEGGVLAGLPRPAARDLAIQTVVGAGRLLAESSDGPEALRAAVTSPGGTTAAGLRALEAAGTRSAVIEAVMAAARRSEELGRA